MPSPAKRHDHPEPGCQDPGPVAKPRTACQTSGQWPSPGPVAEPRASGASVRDCGRRCAASYATSPFIPSVRMLPRCERLNLYPSDAAVNHRYPISKTSPRLGASGAG
jgi:hypothetical protein